MAHILITGGGGLLGSWIIRKLLKAGHQTTVLDVVQHKRRWDLVLSEEQIEKVVFRPVGVDDPDGIRAVFEERCPDGTIHLAGLQSPACQRDPIAGARANVVGALAVFEASCAQPNKPPVVYASTAATMGRGKSAGSASDGEWAQSLPITHHGVFKRCIEMSARVYWLEHELRSVGLRPHTVYGPGRDVGMISFPTRAIAAAVMGESFSIPFSGYATYTYAEEIAEYFVSAVTDPKPDAPVFTVGGTHADVPTFIGELARLVPEAGELITNCGGEPPMPAKLDGSALREAYPGIEPVPLPEGIQDTVSVFRKLRDSGRLSIR